MRVIVKGKDSGKILAEKTVTVNVSCENRGDWSTNCTFEGVKTRKSSLCGSIDSQTIPKMLSHTWSEWSVSKAATCTEDGQQTRKCTLCGKAETKTIDKTGHHYQETIVPPTYTEQGYTLHKCTGCGDSYKDSYVAKKKGFDPSRKPIASEVKKLQQLLSRTVKPAASEDVVDMFDANSDGKVNVIDVIILKRRAVKK